MFKLEVKQEGADTLKFLKRIKDLRIESILRKYGEAGVSALMAATPVDTGKTASMWGYEIEKTSSGWTINWTNDNVNNYVNIAVILQYGHGTGTGGYVAGRDYINPAMAPIFDKLADEAWNEVTKV